MEERRLHIWDTAKHLITKHVGLDFLLEIGRGAGVVPFCIFFFFFRFLLPGGGKAGGGGVFLRSSYSAVLHTAQLHFCLFPPFFAIH